MTWLPTHPTQAPHGEARLGWQRVAVYTVVLAVAMGLLALAVNAIARWRAAPQKLPAS